MAEDAIDDGGSTLARTPEGTVVAIVPQEEQFRRLQGPDGRKYGGPALGGR